MTRWVKSAAVLAALVSIAASARAQQAEELPVPGVPAAKRVPGAHDLPDPGVTYKVVFDIARGADSVTKVNPGLLEVGQYLNTLAAYGVPAEHRRVAVVLHRDATEAILTNDAFRARNDGRDNPNVELLRKLKKAGVELHVCGQAVLAKHIDPQTIMPEIQLDLWALTTLTNLELQGYVHVGG